MQKSQRKGSILLWAICISFILVFLFASFSSKLSEKIRLERSLVGTIQDVFSQDGFTTGTGSNSLVRLDKVNQEIYSMKEKENQEFRFTGTGTFPIRIGLLKGGPLLYKFVSFSGATLMGGTSSSGFIDTEVSFSGVLNSNYDSAILYLKNLGGYTSYNITSGVPFIPPSEKYESVKIIGGDEKIKSVIPHKQFTPGDWGELDYDKLDMEF